MFLMFGDDSGDAREKWRVFGAICLDEIEAFELKKFLSAIKAENLIDTKEELKPLRNKYKSVTLTKEKSQEITFAVYDRLNSMVNLKIYGLFFKNKYLNDTFQNRKGELDYRQIDDYCYRSACECIYDKFDILLNQKDYPYTKPDTYNIPKLGIVVFDEPSSKMSKTILDTMRQISSRGTKWRPASLVFWGVTFSSSESNFGIESSGFVAYALRRAINEDNLAFINPIKSKIHRNSEGFVDNYGASFFTGQRDRHLRSKEGRIKLLEGLVGKNFVNLIYKEKILR